MNRIATIEAVESFLPDRSHTIEELAGSLGLKRAQVRLLQKVHGLHRIRQDPDAGLLDLVLPAARRVLQRVSDPTDIRYVLYVHSTQEVTPSHLDAAALIRDALDLQHAASFAVTQQNCATALAAIELAGTLLEDEGDPYARVLIITGDKAFTPGNQLLYNTGALMGEAGAALLVASPDAAGDRVLSYATKTMGQYSGGVLLSPEESKQYGRDSARALADVMREAVQRAKLTWEDIHWVIPHNAPLTETVTLLGIDPKHVYLEKLAEYSHCFASDVFINYTELRASHRLQPGRHYVYVASGLGATYSSMVFQHQAPAPAPLTAV
ncbi:MULTISPECIES: 3-oxoacyl-[acyl-carrier-protein] synthase III C-terminal domain-containing protein [unclassified Streptomyces]|uniref:3-oxoacyl-[acyl-carrier-protein] synthase III C-terminal domain-containing protein n=1 Tax=unclassified Streptomyces TaxID=2593676 RepID=UPI00035CDE41|nr:MULTISPECIES: 3-oxoacyl-[acyl-carrier-protein] synthase III C-terminal domain-containing protein [unclassified Streptomyces]MYT31691.1 3-oxoacyl-ACP synthase [Streptomyces sp. SID8354]